VSSIQLDSTGVWQVRWPKKHALIIALVEAYLAYESNLPPEQRVSAPALSQVQEASDRAKTAVAAAGSGEAIRATAAETYRQTMHQARPLLEIALLRLKGKYATNLAQLENWGLATKEGKRGVSVRKPANQSQSANFLLSYVAQESSRPEEDRIANPPLEQMAALAETVQQSSAARKGGRAGDYAVWRPGVQRPTTVGLSPPAT